MDIFNVVMSFHILRLKILVRSGIRTHAHIRGPECSFVFKGRDGTLESGALDRSAILTFLLEFEFLKNLHKTQKQVVEKPNVSIFVV